MMRTQPGVKRADEKERETEEEEEKEERGGFGYDVKRIKRRWLA